MKSKIICPLLLALAAIEVSATAQQPKALAPHPPIPIKFSLKEAGFVTLVIEDQSGKRVRNLVSETPFPAGENTAWWDGLDDIGRDPEAAGHAVYHVPGKMVAAGRYAVRGLFRKQIDLRYQMAPYSNGNPPWNTADKGSEWLANHTPPQTALFVPEAETALMPAGRTAGGQVLVGSPITEGGSGLAWLDLNGNKKYGVGWIGGNWSGAGFLARDVGTQKLPDTYAFVGASISNELRLTALTKNGDRPVLTPTYALRRAAGAGDVDSSDVGGIAVRNNLLVASLRKIEGGKLLLVDAMAGKELGTVPLADGRGVAFDAQGRLLVLSGQKLLRLTLPRTIVASTRLDSTGWTATASVRGEAAPDAIDGNENSRWSTNAAQQPGQSFTLDMQHPQRFSRLVLRGNTSDMPRAYQVSVSDDGQIWKPVASGEGSRTSTMMISFERVQARYVKIEQTGSLTPDFFGYWSINSLDVVNAPTDSDLAILTRPQSYGAALSRRGWVAADASQKDAVARALDGDFSSRWDSGGSQVPGQSIAIDMQTPQTFSRVAMLSTASTDDSPAAFEVYVSNDGQNWGKPIASGHSAGQLATVAFPKVSARYLKIVQTGRSGSWWGINELNLYAAANLDAPAKPAPLPAPQVLAANLQDPQGIALDAAGNIFVSDQGTSHQVKVFDASGKYLRSIGHAGAPSVGAYDEGHMNHPHGLAIDGRGQLWVAENEYSPKRISVWNAANGALLKAFYGPPIYGGGGELDSQNPTLWHYMGMTFKLDWANRSARPIDIYSRTASPQTPLYFNGKRYMTNCYNSNPTGGSSAGLWRVDEKGVARAVAQAASTSDFPLFQGLSPRDNDFSVRWSGTVTPKYSQTYTFSTQTDDGVRLWVNGQQIIDNWASGVLENSGTMALQAGKPVSIKMEYFQGNGGHAAHLSWSSASQTKNIIPASAFAPAAGSKQHGLKAEYFNGTNFDQLRSTLIEPTIDTDWANGLPLEPKAAPYAALAPKGANFFFWQDKNGDGEMQPEEVTFRALKDGGIDGVTVMPDLSFVVTNMDGQTVRFAPMSIAASGVPAYDASRLQVLASGVQHPTTSGGGQALAARDGWTILTVSPQPFAPYGMAGVKGGVTMWSYPSMWPGLHASHISPLPDHPGEMIGTTRLVGGTITPRGADGKPGQGGEMWAINGNMGNIYLMTTDGLFVATLFKDHRTAGWDFPQAKPDLLVNEASNGQESFWPELTQTNDGRVFLTAGTSFILRVDGLDSIQRLPSTSVQITPASLEAARTYFVQSEAARQAGEGAAKSVLTVALRGAAPIVDGKLDDWAGADWATIDVRSQQQGDWGRGDIKTEGAVSVSGDRLYAAFKTNDGRLLSNSGDSLPNLFKFGGALDLMIGATAGGERLLVTQVKDKTTAVLYRPRVPGTTSEPVAFSSPLRTIKFDRVDDVSDQVQLAGDGAGNYELSVPLQVLGLKPQAGQSLKGDIGILRGNGFQTLQRVYWRNKASGITADVPSEAELTPQLWGQWQFKSVP